MHVEGRSEYGVPQCTGAEQRDPAYFERRLLSDAELLPFLDNAGTGSPMFADKVVAFMRHQQSEAGCVAIRRGYAQLEAVQRDEFETDGMTFQVQFNPMRIRNTVGTVQTNQVSGERPCFLCPAHMMDGERGLSYDGDNAVFGNPYPILRDHLVIVSRDHRPQQVGAQASVALDLARELADTHFVFYNGPQVGATAPSHAHLQAGARIALPIEQDVDRMELFEPHCLMPINLGANVDSFIPGGIGRTVAVIRSDDKRSVLEALSDATSMLPCPNGMPEAPLNVVYTYRRGVWTSYVFPRSKFRPARFEDSIRPIKISPAALEMAGIIVTARAEDFDTVTRSPRLVREILEEVSAPVTDLADGLRRGRAATHVGAILFPKPVPAGRRL